ITCVDRDDLKDGGAAHWAATIRAVKARSPELVLEVLVGDFKGDTGAVDTVLRETRAIGVDILTLGQYLRPSRQHLPIARYLPPEEFAQLKDEALALGF